MAGRPHLSAVDRDAVRHRIGELVIDFDVTPDGSGLKAPEDVLHKVRAAILPALAAELEGPDCAGASAQIEVLELDLGHWPADADWDAVARQFRESFQTLLQRYLRWPSEALEAPRDATESDKSDKTPAGDNTRTKVAVLDTSDVQTAAALTNRTPGASAGSGDLAPEQASIGRYTSGSVRSVETHRFKEHEKAGSAVREDDAEVPDTACPPGAGDIFAEQGDELDVWTQQAVLQEVLGFLRPHLSPSAFRDLQAGLHVPSDGRESETPERPEHSLLRGEKPLWFSHLLPEQHDLIAMALRSDLGTPGLDEDAAVELWTDRIHRVRSASERLLPSVRAFVEATGREDARGATAQAVTRIAARHLARMAAAQKASERQPENRITTTLGTEDTHQSSTGSGSDAADTKGSGSVSPAATKPPGLVENIKRLITAAEYTDAEAEYFLARLGYAAEDALTHEDVQETGRITRTLAAAEAESDLGSSAPWQTDPASTIEADTAQMSERHHAAGEPKVDAATEPPPTDVPNQNAGAPFPRDVSTADIAIDTRQNGLQTAPFEGEDLTAPPQTQVDTNLQRENDRPSVAGKAHERVPLSGRPGTSAKTVAAHDMAHDGEESGAPNSSQVPSTPAVTQATGRTSAAETSETTPPARGRQSARVDTKQPLSSSADPHRDLADRGVATANENRRQGAQPITSRPSSDVEQAQNTLRPDDPAETRPQDEPQIERKAGRSAPAVFASRRGGADEPGLSRPRYHSMASLFLDALGTVAGQDRQSWQALFEMIWHALPGDALRKINGSPQTPILETDFSRPASVDARRPADTVSPDAPAEDRTPVAPEKGPLPPEQDSDATRPASATETEGPGAGDAARTDKARASPDVPAPAHPTPVFRTAHNRTMPEPRATKASDRPLQVRPAAPDVPAGRDTERRAPLGAVPDSDGGNKAAASSRLGDKQSLDIPYSQKSDGPDADGGSPRAATPEAMERSFPDGRHRGYRPAEPEKGENLQKHAATGKTVPPATSDEETRQAAPRLPDAEPAFPPAGRETEIPVTASPGAPRVPDQPAPPTDTVDEPMQARSDPRYLRALSDLLLGAPGSDTRFEDQLAAVLDELVPEPARRRRILRAVAARLGYADGRHAPALRRQARAAVEACLDRGVVTPAEIDPAPTSAGLEKRVYLSNCAGLVLFAPYLPLLFDRLGLLDEARRLKPESISTARRALQLLSDFKSREAAPTDPLEKLLLGQEQRWRWAGAPADPPPDVALLIGLVQSVIARWAALGQTSPEGLQEAFVRRGGSLRQTEDAWRLTVDPGPFDMLLDQLPWSFGTIAMPWMATPLHVDWREQDD